MAKMIYCKQCGKEIAESAKMCPNCGTKNKKPFFKQVWFWIVAVFLIIGIAASNGNSNNSSANESSATGKTKTKSDLVLEDGHSGSPDSTGFAYYIEGYIKNETDKDYSYVSVTFTAYDSDGNTLGTCLDNNSGLEAGGRWKFKAMCLDEVDKIASYKLKSITKY